MATIFDFVEAVKAREPIDSDIKPDQGPVSKFPYRTANPTELDKSARGYLERTQTIMKQVAEQGAHIKGHGNDMKNRNGEGINPDVKAANEMGGPIPEMVMGGARPVVRRPELPVAPVALPALVEVAIDVPALVNALPPAKAVPIIERDDVNYNVTAKFWRLIKPLQNIGWDAEFNVNALADWYSKLSEEDSALIGEMAGRVIGFNAVETIVVPAVALKGDNPSNMKEWERLCEIVAVQLLRGEEQWYNITGPDAAMAEYWYFMWTGVAEYAPLFGHMKGSEVLRGFYDAIWNGAKAYIEEKLREENDDEDE